MFFKAASRSLGQSYVCPSVKDVTLMNTVIKPQQDITKREPYALVHLRFYVYLAGWLNLRTGTNDGCVRLYKLNTIVSPFRKITLTNV